MKVVSQFEIIQHKSKRTREIKSMWANSQGILCCGGETVITGNDRVMHHMFWETDGTYENRLKLTVIFIINDSAIAYMIHQLFSL